MDESGVLFPLDDQGKRSTTPAGKGTFAAAIKPVDADAANRILGERSWRFKYARHVVDQVRKSAEKPENALKVAKAGLQHVHSTFQFVRDGKSMSVKEAMATFKGHSYHTGVVKGKGAKPTRQSFAVPYKGQVLTGNNLLVQIEKWEKYGTIEPDCAHALTQVVNSPHWLDLSGKCFVLLGALSAMGPLHVLLSLGATIVAVDLDRPAIWERLVALAEKSCGTLVFPLAKKQSELKTNKDLCEAAGCNLLTATPEIAHWIAEQHEDHELVVGAYAYLDSDLFVRLSVAMDAIIDHVCTKRERVSLAYLCTPTDCHLVPPTAHAAELQAFRKEAGWMGLVRLLSGGKLLQKNAARPIEPEAGDPLHLVDAIVVDQGPNYILAKRIQHWRAMVAREEHKHVVSTNIAPSTATVSVVKNRSFAWAYNGMHHFKPMEVFMQDTSNAVMTGMLLYDLCDPSSPAKPEVPLRNPLQLFQHGAFHGGAWRTAHKFTTIGVPSALLYFLGLLVSAYLALYNAAQAVGWMLGLVGVITSLADPANNGNVWNAAGPWVTLFQTLSLLEVLHAMLGMTTSPVPVTALQIASRVFVVGVAATNPSTHASPGLALMLFAWSLTEVVRYSYYACSLAGVKLGVLTWLRYTLFIVLYPSGVLGELLTVKEASHTMTASIASLNVTGAEPGVALYGHMMKFVQASVGQDVGGYVLYALAPMYALGLPFLYSYMLAQRQKVLGRRGAKKAKRD